MRATIRAALAFGLLFTAVAGCSDDDDGPDRDEEGSISEEGDLSAFSMEVGDCFDDPDSLTMGTNSTVFELPAVPCNQPHDNEVFALIDLEGDDDDYPGQDAVLTEGQERCEAAFEDYVGVSFDESALSMDPYLFPTEQTWSAGDREIVCALYAADLSKLSGSKADSGE